MIFYPRQGYFIQDKTSLSGVYPKPGFVGLGLGLGLGLSSRGVVGINKSARGNKRSDATAVETTRQAKTKEAQAVWQRKGMRATMYIELTQATRCQYYGKWQISHLFTCADKIS